MNRAGHQDIGTYSAMLGCVFMSMPRSAGYMQALSVGVCLPWLVDFTTLINICNIQHMILSRKEKKKN
jgi:hypothetical protein